jgi:hypothetical protein
MSSAMWTSSTRTADEPAQRTLVLGIAWLILEPFEHHARTHEATHATAALEIERDVILGEDDIPEHIIRQR